MVEAKVVFLEYISRSGSTLLAKKLDEFIDIGVSLEANYFKNIPRGEVNISSENNLEKILAILLKDEKIACWNLNKSALLKRLSKHTYPICSCVLLKELLAEYFHDKLYTTHIIKGCGAVLYSPSVDKHLIDSKIIFITRDPRAIFNSQKKAINSLTDVAMNSDVVQFVRIYKKYYKKISKIKNQNYFHEIKYEDLLLKEDNEINKILSFLGARNKKNSSSNYYHKIPESQKHLHVNVKTDTNKVDRIDAWINELPKHEICFLERVLQKELLAYDYSPQKHQPTEIKQNYKLLLLMGRYQIYKIWDYLKFTYPGVSNFLSNFLFRREQGTGYNNR